MLLQRVSELISELLGEVYPTIHTYISISNLSKKAPQAPQNPIPHPFPNNSSSLNPFLNLANPTPKPLLNILITYTSSIYMY